MSGIEIGSAPPHSRRTNPRRLLAIGFGILLALPLLQMFLPIFHEKHLTGVPYRMKPLHVSLKSWWDGDLTETIEANLTRRIGFRPSLVRTANQLQLAFGADPAIFENREVRVCGDNWLITQRYLSHYANPSTRLNDSDVSQFVTELKELQDRLRADGKAMVFLISPSKAETYPESLPEWALQARRSFRGVSDLERVRKHLAGSGVVFFDTPRYFQQHKDTTPQKFYTKTSSHWTYYTAFEVWQELLLLINKEYGKNLPLPEQIGVEYDQPRGTDDDIAKLLNVFTLPGVEKPVAYPIIKTNALPYSNRPNFLFAGTSFCRTLIDTMYPSESGAACDYIFYNSCHFAHNRPVGRIPAGTQTEMEATDIDGYSTLDWDKVLLDKDVVILEMLENKASELLYGFHREALAALRYRTLPDRIAIRPVE